MNNVKGLVSSKSFICLLLIICAVIASRTFATPLPSRQTTIYWTMPAKSEDGVFTISVFGIKTSSKLYEKVPVDGSWRVVWETSAGNHTKSFERRHGAHSFKLATCELVPWPPGPPDAEPISYKPICTDLNEKKIEIDTSGRWSAIPQLSLASHDADGSFTLSWGAADCADAYEYQEKLNAGSWTALKRQTARRSL